MSAKKRIVLIHATRVAMVPIETTFAELWPEVELVSFLEEGLSKDRANKRVPDEAIDCRIMDLAVYSKSLAPDAILFTCSAFGEAIEAVAKEFNMPVLKPNEAMFEEALKTHLNVVMLYTFAPAVLGMEEEFRHEAKRISSSATIRSVFVEGALNALHLGDVKKHNSLIAKTASLVTDADVILLAHFSMSTALNEVQVATVTPILTSPHAAVKKCKQVCVQ